MGWTMAWQNWSSVNDGRRQQHLVSRHPSRRGRQAGVQLPAEGWMQPLMPTAASKEPERSESRGPAGRMPCPSTEGRWMGCRRRLRRSERRGRRARKTSTRDANKPEEEKNWWALAHFRRLGAGAVGVNLARSDTRIGSANKLGSGLALCWSRSFYCFYPKLVFSTAFWVLLEML